ncbi:MAG: sulfotransferase, partial [Acidobacteriota bacterium]|nr:sulfotransferase [Acidobacteriota bacterium]
MVLDREAGLRPSGPVFILSTVRTGSTLLRYCLDTHPDLLCPPELYLGLAATSLFRAVAGLEGSGVSIPLGGTVSAAVAAANPHVVARVRGILEELIAPHLAGQGKRVWCEKSPSNLQHLALLDQLFPEARFVCLYRDCRDVAKSLLDFSPFGYMQELRPYVQASPENTLAALFRFWADETALLIDFERQHPDRAHRVRYEDLVAVLYYLLEGI